jgi:hypothetical protein
MMDNRSMGKRLRQPADCICGPPMPSSETPGSRFLISRISPAPSKSPEASPATIPILVTGLAATD